ncbi:DUF6968 family protein [Dyella acidisoli]|uniref:DUF6968 domain-containing protein n=1 Tax=Dyella acidisoli TaxID=1867834 RepID=A0ABQ5XXU5_9GAMM|nr:hypothetical protein [Dyella acidisoli]GLQ95250.1 hypothetical protein GCM10007901_42050 [Dyella acidisoli]
MKLEKVNSVIAKRTLQAKDGREIEIIFGTPEEFPDGKDFYCPFQVIGLGDERVRYAGGVDSMQALLLALKKLSYYITSRDEVMNGEVQWLGEPDLGLLPAYQDDLD